jgi:hypothetical protein
MGDEKETLGSIKQSRKTEKRNTDKYELNRRKHVTKGRRREKYNSEKGAEERVFSKFEKAR